MKTTQSFGVHFTIRSDKEKDGKSPIYVCTVNSKKCFFAAKQSIESQSWDKCKGLPKGSKDNIRAISTYLENLRRTLGNIYQQMQLKGTYITSEAITILIQTSRFTSFQIFSAITMKPHWRPSSQSP
jgi:hypothetical protein